MNYTHEIMLKLNSKFNEGDWKLKVKSLKVKLRRKNDNKIIITIAHEVKYTNHNIALK